MSLYAADGGERAVRNVQFSKKLTNMSLVSYVKESYNELVNKVSWTPVKELQSLAITVMVASVIFALVILLMDVSFEAVMKQIYKLLAR